MIPDYLLTFQQAVLEQEKRAGRQSHGGELSELSERSLDLISLNTLNSPITAQPKASFERFADPLAELEQRCPNHVGLAEWRTAVRDGRQFIAIWGVQAERLGWTVADLFGLHEPLAHPVATYRRLSRHDCAGLLWCLDGRPVVALTEEAATIRTRAGALSWRRRAGLLP